MYSYKGHLEMYFETGISFAMIYLKHTHPDPWKKTFALDKKTKLTLQIKNPQTKELVYSGPWTFDIKHSSKNGYIASPKEISPELWKEYVFKHYEVEFETEKALPVDLCSLKINYLVDIWEIKLTGEKNLIAKDARVFSVEQNSHLIIDKSPKRWISEYVVSNFNSEENSVYVQTEKEFFLIKKSETALI